MNYSILVLNENNFSKNIITGILEAEGYKIIQLIDELSFEWSEHNQPDVIVCDYLLYESNLLKSIKEKLAITQSNENIPLVIICSQKDNSHLGNDKYIVNTPFSAEDIITAVSTQLRKKLNNRFISPKENIYSQNNSEDKIQFSLNQFSKYIQLKKYDKNEKIFSEGDDPNFVYIIYSGKIKISKMNSWGKEFIIEVLKENDFFGYTSVLNECVRKKTAVTIEESKIGLIPVKDFKYLLYSNNEISFYITKYISAKLSFASEKAMQLAYDSARKRVANALIYITNISNLIQSTISLY